MGEYSWDVWVGGKGRRGQVGKGRNGEMGMMISNVSLSKKRKMQRVI